MRRLIIAFCFLLMLGFFPGWAQNSSYIIGSGDEVSVTFWQDPQLNLQCIIGDDGTITLPVGGVITANGLTLEQLGHAIVQRISLYDRRITQASVRIVNYGSQKVYVMGNVRQPNKYTFEVIPNLWQIITEAGGPTENANLSHVLIVRKTGETPQTIEVDLAQILRSRDFQALPSIQTGDNIYIPAVVGNVPSSGMDALQPQQNVLFIFGEVGHPGVFTFNKELNLLEALITAGGPTAQAQLDNVRVVRKTEGYSTVIKVNVARYANQSSPSFFMVKGGDTIYVPRKRIFRESMIWDFSTIFLSALITVSVYSMISER